MTDILSPLAYLCGKPTAKAKLKASPEHFQVTEDLGYTLNGSGEHFMVRIRKTGENTSFVANELAKACGVKSRDVGWAGQKDRHAVTEQWLSVHLPAGETPDLSEFQARYPSIKVLETTRHNRKLRPGDLKGNHFILTLTEVSDMDEVLRRLEIIRAQGMPNYFGSQRFGKEGNNLTEARRWGRDNVRSRNQNQRSMLLSAARSWIFNRIVSARIETGCFNQFISGDLALSRNNSDRDEQIKVTTGNIEALNLQLQTGLAAITAALAGDNALPVEDEALVLEQQYLDEEPELMLLIRGNRMRHDRWPISLIPEQFTWTVDNGNLVLSFSLDAGSFATAVVRELVEEIPVERSFNG